MSTLSFKHQRSLAGEANAIQCVEGAARFVLFHRSLSLLDTSKKSSVKALTQVTASCANGDAYVHVSVSEDAAYALLLGDSDLQLWSLATQSQVASLNNKWVAGSRFLPNSHRAVVNLATLARESKDGPTHFVLYDADQHKLSKKGLSTWTSASIPKDIELVGSDHLLVVKPRLYAKVYNVEAGSEKFELEAPDIGFPSGEIETPPTASGVIPSRRSNRCVLIHECSGGTTLSSWDLAAGKATAHIPWVWPSHHGRILGSLHPDGRYVALSGDDSPKTSDPKRVMRVIDVVQNKLAQTWVFGSSIKTFAFLPDKTHAISTSEHRLQLWAIKQKKHIDQIELDAPIVSWALSSSGQLLISTDDDKLSLYSLEGYEAPHGIDSTQAEYEVYSETAIALGRNL